VHPLIASHLEMRRVASRAQYVCGVTADQEGPAGLVMIVEGKPVRVLGQSASIERHLAVILTPILER
jgi:hypothetical protein